jgi:RNA polymerase sigma-70 factor (ECF subfamily)
MLHKEFYGSLCGFALKYLRNEALAEDIVQEAFLSLWSAKDTLRNQDAAKPFLYSTVRNKCISFLRKQNASISIPENILSEEFLEEALIKSETIRILYNAIENLPEQTRKIISLSLDGLKNSEIGKELNISENTVHTLKKAGYKKLRALLKDHYYLIFYLNLIEV